MSLDHIRQEGLSHIEEKFSLIKIDENIYEGKHPLEPFAAGGRGTYGGEFLCQTLLAAWSTVDDEFSPNSLHSHFVKAGSQKSVMKYEVLRTNDGRNFAHRTVQVFQKHTGVLCFTMIVLFTKKNSRKDKIQAYSEDTTGRITPPFGFQGTPHAFLKKYKDKLDTIPYWEHTNNNLRHVIPKEYIDTKYNDRLATLPAGERKLGAFVKVNDDLSLAKDQLKAKVLAMTFASDSFWLSSIIRILGLPLKPSSLNFFRVSLDHSIWFHDVEYDPS